MAAGRVLIIEFALCALPLPDHVRAITCVQRILRIDWPSHVDILKSVAQQPRLIASIFFLYLYQDRIWSQKKAPRIPNHQQLNTQQP
jgi:hypothetical protein